MNNRHTPLKTTLLFAPLLFGVLSLHAWGEGLSVSLARTMTNWQYPERVHGAFLIRVPRRSDADGFAARTLEDFVSESLRTQGAALGIHALGQPVRIVLLDPDADPRRFGCAPAEELRENEGVFDPDLRMIVVRMERKLQQEQVMAALRQAAARLLLHDAGSARWSPWLAEGLAGSLEGSRTTDLRFWTNDLPAISDLLGMPSAMFSGRSGSPNARGAHLLAAWLTEERRDAFASFYRAERKGGPAPRSLFQKEFGDPDRIEGEWRAWIHSQLSQK